MIGNQIRHIPLFLMQDTVLHHIRAHIMAAAASDCIPFGKSMLRAQAVSQMPFTGQGAGVAVPFQHIRIGGHSIQISDRPVLQPELPTLLKLL